MYYVLYSTMYYSSISQSIMDQQFPPHPHVLRTSALYAYGVLLSSSFSISELLKGLSAHPHPAVRLRRL